MGTGNSGRYLNTKGSVDGKNDRAAAHSPRGSFTHDQQGCTSHMKSDGSLQGPSLEWSERNQNAQECPRLQHQSKRPGVEDASRHGPATSEEGQKTSKVSDEYRRLLELRKSYRPEEVIDYENDPVIRKMIEALSADIDDTICFLGECTSEEFVWMSEIFDRIAEVMHSLKFVNALYENAKKLPDECEKSNVIDLIDKARDIVQKG